MSLALLPAASSCSTSSCRLVRAGTSLETGRLFSWPISPEDSRIPAHPVDTEGLAVPELFKQVLDDLSEFLRVKAFGYNIDVLAPQNFNEVMYTGFREVIDGMRSPAEQAGALQRAWAEAKEAGKTPAQE
jgi:hypothetical protein